MRVFDKTAYGCPTIDRGYMVVEKATGIPSELVQADCFFYKWMGSDWRTRFLDAVAIGADLSLVAPRFLLWLVRDSGMPGADHPAVAPAIASVVVVLDDWCRTGYEPERRAREAANTVDTAMKTGGVPHDAWLAADVALRAAYSVADLSGSITHSIIQASDGAVDLRRMADKLIELLEAAPKGE
jgi:hypothetical protein